MTHSFIRKYFLLFYLKIHIKTFTFENKVIIDVIFYFFTVSLHKIVQYCAAARVNKNQIISSSSIISRFCCCLFCLKLKQKQTRL